MKTLLSAWAVLMATLAWLALLFAARPFDRASEVLDREFGALPSWSLVTNVYRDPSIQEVSRGDHPLDSFRQLREYWANHDGALRIMLMGNSQTLTVSLAAGEPLSRAPEKTYGDLIAEHFREQGSQTVFYRLSAGGLSYEEMLWYACYLSLKPQVKPAIFLVQMNYQTFENGGIREGMLEMLTDKEFRKSIESLASENRAYSETFAQSLKQFDQRDSQAGERSATERTETDGGPTAGYALESSVRQELDTVPGFARRANFKESFFLMLLRCRSYFLHIQQSTPRSLTGSRLEASRAALVSLLELSGRAGIRTIVFQAPTNPSVRLYRTKDDDSSYHDFASRLVGRFGLTSFDFEHSIPAGNWGMALNSPDPLHLSRAGHHMLASLMMQQLKQHGI